MYLSVNFDNKIAWFRSGRMRSEKSSQSRPMPFYKKSNSSMLAPIRETSHTYINAYPVQGRGSHSNWVIRTSDSYVSGKLGALAQSQDLHNVVNVHIILRPKIHFPFLITTRGELSFEQTLGPKKTKCMLARLYRKPSRDHCYFYGCYHIIKDSY